MQFQWLQALFHVPGDPDARRRGRTIITIVLLQFALLAIAVPVIMLSGVTTTIVLTMGLSFLLYLIVISLVRMGRLILAAMLLVFSAFTGSSFAVLGTPDSIITIYYLVIPILIAGLVLSPWHVWGVFFLCLITVAIEVNLNRAILTSSQSITVLVNALLVIFSVSMISFLGTLMMSRTFNEVSHAQSTSEQARRELVELNANLEHQVEVRTSDLQTAFQTVQAQANAQQALLDQIANQRELIREMGVPVLPLSSRTLVMPLMGILDDERLHSIQMRATEAVETYNAKTLLVDITGVMVVDTYVAQGLLRTIQTVRLLGARVILIGVRPEVAQSMVSLGIDLHEVHTARDLASVLRQLR